MKRSLFAIILFLGFALVSASLHAECIDWGKMMSKYYVDNVDKSKTIITLQPFEDYTKIAGDDWLSYGIPNLLEAFISTGKDATPMFALNAKYYPAASNAKYKIEGMYQHFNDRLRIFVKLMESGNLKRQWQLDIVYPDNKQFFNTIGSTALSILSEISPPYDKDRFEAIKVETSAIKAYENYVRGVMAYQLFDPQRAEIVKTWFDESKKADIYYMNAYLGTIDLYTFLAMYNKQNKKPFANYLEQAEREISMMEKYSRRPPLPERPRKVMLKVEDKQLNLNNRYILANTSFVAALEAEKRKDWHEAIRNYEMATTQTPEDAITWYQLSKVYDRVNDKHKASVARSKAFELNSCLQ